MPILIAKNPLDFLTCQAMGINSYLSLMLDCRTHASPGHGMFPRSPPGREEQLTQRPAFKRWMATLLALWCMSVGAQTTLKPGDLDGDGRVTVVDLVILNNYLNGNINLTITQQSAADLNLDSLINQADADLLANVILGQSPQVSGGNSSVILATDNSGDFGPQTPGTQTAGWQEALDFCVAHQRDLYVKGGYGGNVVFNVAQTINFPPAQDFRIDGGVYVINYVGNTNNDCVVLDSCMNCDYTLGIIVYGGAKAALRIKPQNDVPIDGFPAFIETVIRSQGIADPNPFTPGPRGPGAGLVLDGSVAGISYSKIYFASVLNFNVCVELLTNGVVYNNEFTIEHLHSNATGGTLIIVGPGARENRFRFGIGVDQGATSVQGILISGSRNEFHIVTRPGGFAANQQIVLQSPAEGNQINLATEEDPATLVTDQANTPSNQLTVTGPPPPVSTIQGVSGTYIYIQRLYPATVTVTAGTSLAVTFQRPGSSPINYGAALNHDFFLSVGDSLIITSSTNPALRIIPFKTK